MRYFCRHHPVWVLAVLIFSSVISPAQQYYDLIGLTALQSTTTNINGTGIRVGQPEADEVTNAGLSYFEVNPSTIGQPTNLFTYISVDGIANVFPNTVGYESDPANDVAGGVYGMDHGMATNVLHVDNFDANFYITNYIANLLIGPTDLVVNQSFTFGPQDASDQEGDDSAYDDYEETYNTFFVSPADDLGTENGASLTVAAPGTA